MPSRSIIHCVFALSVATSLACTTTNVVTRSKLVRTHEEVSHPRQPTSLAPRVQVDGDAERTRVVVDVDVAGSCTVTEAKHYEDTRYETSTGNGVAANTGAVMTVAGLVALPTGLIAGGLAEDKTISTAGVIGGLAVFALGQVVWALEPDETTERPLDTTVRKELAQESRACTGVPAEGTLVQVVDEGGRTLSSDSTNAKGHVEFDILASDAPHHVVVAGKPAGHAAFSSHTPVAVEPTPALTEPAENEPTVELPLRFEITRTGITLNDVAIPLQPKLEFLVGLLGKPSRVTTGANRVHVYDELGVLLYEPYDGNVKQITIQLTARERYEHTPHEAFAGALTVGQRMLDANTETELGARVTGSVLDTKTSYRFPAQGYGVSLNGSPKHALEDVVVDFQRPPYTGSEPHPQELECERGNAAACSVLAFSFSSGHDFPKNYAKALRYGTKACQGGSALGCVILASIHREGKGIPASHVKAREYDLRACQLGLSLPQCER